MSNQQCQTRIFNKDTGRHDPCSKQAIAAITLHFTDEDTNLADPEDMLVCQEHRDIFQAMYPAEFIDHSPAASPEAKVAQSA
jgi:hypothetical protein